MSRGYVIYMPRFIVWLSEARYPSRSAKGMELIDNIRKTLKDDFIQEISKGSKLSITSEWQLTDDVKVPLAGLNLDSVWENIVATIGSITIVGSNSIVEQIAEDDAHAKLMKQIEQMEKKSRTEKQPRKKLELFERLKELKNKL